jgi:hypothetical protein
MSQCPLFSKFVVKANDSPGDKVAAMIGSLAFGNFTPPDSKLLTPVVIFSAQLDFIYVTGSLYVLLAVMQPP